MRREEVTDTETRWVYEREDLMPGWSGEGVAVHSMIAGGMGDSIILCGVLAPDDESVWGTAALQLPPEMCPPSFLQDYPQVTVSPDGRVIPRFRPNDPHACTITGVAFYGPPPSMTDILGGVADRVYAASPPPYASPLTRAERAMAWAIFWPEWVWARIAVARDYLVALHALWRDEYGEARDGEDGR